MNSGSTNSCFPNVSQSLQIYSMIEDHQHNHHNQHVALSSASNDQTHSSNSLLNSLSLLKEKVHQVQSFVSILLSPNHQNQPESTSIVIASMTHVIQEIIMTASSMTFNFQQMGSFGSITSGINTSTTTTTNNNVIRVGNLVQERVSQALYTTTTTSDDRTLDWFSEIYNNNISNNRVDERKVNIIPLGSETKDGFRGFSSKHCDIIELNASYLLAKYTHYCQVCGKGFKRDANLRMHMRAHGDEYKTNAALTNPFKNNTSTIMGNKDSSILRSLPRKYSCPQEGCRWNKKHAKFHPLKSMICVKNHYKRSHCPKIYVCKRCNKKQFSVLSDLRTHEKHCGDLKWQCSCGTTFSRKDKLMGHVALFTGHIPIVTSSTKHGKNDDQNQVSQMQ